MWNLHGIIQPTKQAAAIPGNTRRRITPDRTAKQLNYKDKQTVFAECYAANIQLWVLCG